MHLVSPAGLQSGFAIKFEMMREAKKCFDIARQGMVDGALQVTALDEIDDKRIYCSEKIAGQLRKLCEYVSAATRYIASFEAEYE